MQNPVVRLGLPALVLIALASCGSDDPADVAGNYTIAITNGQNGCNFMDWTVGTMTSGIPVVVAQDGGSATATVNGLAGLALNTRLGSNVFTGSVGSGSMTLKLFGTRSFTQGMCTFTINATLRAGVDGDVLTGDIDYTTATNGAPDCGTLQGCESTQAFNGTRPPTR